MTGGITQWVLSCYLEFGGCSSYWGIPLCHYGIALPNNKHWDKIDCKQSGGCCLGLAARVGKGAVCVRLVYYHTKTLVRSWPRPDGALRPGSVFTTGVVDCGGGQGHCCGWRLTVYGSVLVCCTSLRLLRQSVYVFLFDSYSLKLTLSVSQLPQFIYSNVTTW